MDERRWVHVERGTDFRPVARVRRLLVAVEARRRCVRVVDEAERVAAAVTVDLPNADSVLVGYSGGKDSLAVLDLCIQAGKRVTPFFMFFLPGMDYTKYWCEYARKRFGVSEVIEIQHWSTTYYLRRGVFRPPADVPSLKVTDIEREVREKTRLDWIGYGYKMIDSLQRRGRINAWPGGISEKYRLFCPLKFWNNSDVLTYLSRRKITTPPSVEGKRSSGISLTPESMYFMRREWPRDYERILKVFPYAAAQADRYERLQKNEATAV